MGVAAMRPSYAHRAGVEHMADQVQLDGGERDKLIARALADIRTLLEFLGCAEDGRLQAHFDDTRDHAPPQPMRSTPPCVTYREFLNRLELIQRVVPETGELPDEPPDGDAPQGVQVQRQARDELSDAAFVMWTRDFLASVAAPATAESVRVTRAYVDLRTTRSSWKSVLDESTADDVKDRAIRLAHAVRRLHLGVIGAVIVTTILSVYALAGQSIVSGRDKAIDNLRTIDGRILDFAQKSTERGLKNVSRNAPDDKPGVIPVCENVELRGEDQSNFYQRGPSFGPIQNGVTVAHLSYDAIDLCRQRRRALVQLFAIGEQVLAWQRAVTDMPLIGRRFVSHVFGRSVDMTKEFSEDRLVCAHFTGKRQQPPGDAAAVHWVLPAECERSLRQLIEYYGRIPDAILGCVNLYMLPIMYGGIGAGVAAMRRVRSRVDAYQLAGNDRGIILQNGVLGIAAGAVIGLFTSYFSDTLHTISISGFAFLAGYNVKALFAMFDSLSAKVFQVAGGARG